MGVRGVWAQPVVPCSNSFILSTLRFNRSCDSFISVSDMPVERYDSNALCKLREFELFGVCVVNNLT